MFYKEFDMGDGVTYKCIWQHTDNIPKYAGKAGIFIGCISFPLVAVILDGTEPMAQVADMASCDSERANILLHIYADCRETLDKLIANRSSNTNATSNSDSINAVK